MKEKWSTHELLLFLEYIEKRMCFGFKALSMDDKERLDEIREIVKGKEGG